MELEFEAYLELGIQGCRNMGIKGFRYLRTQGFKELGNWELRDLEIKRYMEQGFVVLGIKG